MSLARDAAAVAGIYDIVARRCGLDRREPPTPEQLDAVMAELEALHLRLSVPFAPDQLPETLSDAVGDAMELHAECMRAMALDGLDPVSRAFLGGLVNALANVVADLSDRSEVARFAAIGRRDARARGWAAFLARCLDLNERERR
jgi:hypothetical protein